MIDDPSQRGSAAVSVSLAFWQDGRQIRTNGNSRSLDAIRIDRIDQLSAPAVCATWLLAAMGNRVEDLAYDLTIEDMQRTLQKSPFGEAELDQGLSLEDLAQWIEQNHAVIAFVDAGICWGWRPASGYSGPNHAILVLAIARSSDSGELVGALIRDPARPENIIAVNASLLADAWLQAGGRMLAVPLPAAAP